MLSIELIAVAVCGGLSLLALYVFTKAEEVLEEAKVEVNRMQKLLDENRLLLKTITEKRYGRSFHAKPRPRTDEETV